MAKKSLRVELVRLIYLGGDICREFGFDEDEAARAILRSRRIKVTWAKKPERCSNCGDTAEDHIAVHCRLFGGAKKPKRNHE